jgi:hypothetical protein
MEKGALQLTIQDAAFLLNQVLKRRTLSRAEALNHVKEKLKRNRAAARSHLRRDKRVRSKSNSTLTL